MHPPISFGPVAAELVLVGAGLVLLLVDAIFPRVPHSALALATLAALAGAAAASAWLWHWHGPLTVLGGMVAADRFAVFERMVILAVAAVGVLLGYHYFRR